MKINSLLFTFLAIILTLPVIHAEKPNVLFIAIDDLNDWAGYRGHPDAITPNMDKLSTESTVFTRAQCQYPVCGPSRASLMSGIFYHSLNLESLQSKDDDVAKAAKKLGSSLLHSYFKENGYKTMAVGKLLHKHIDLKDIDQSGGREKWDIYKDEKGNRKKIHWKSQKTLTDWDIYKGEEEDLSDTKTANWAVERLKEHHNQPFMLMLGFLHPHVPWYAPKEYFDLYNKESLTLPYYSEGDLKDIPDAGKKLLNKGYPTTDGAIQNNTWRDMLHAYLANISYVDRQLGKVIDALEASPYSNNTVIVLWSDHGYHMGEKNMFQKDTLWNRSTQAPLMLKVPKVTKGETCQRVVSLMDIYPTLVDICGLPQNKKLFGRSLSPLLKLPEQQWNFPSFTFRKDGGRSIHFRNWHLIEYHDGTLELYDHDKDYLEKNNLALNVEFLKKINELQSLFNERHAF